MRHGLAKLLKTRAENSTHTLKAEFSLLPGNAEFPLIITPGSSDMILTEWIRANKYLFDEKLNLHGAILFRGFGIDTVEKFQHFISVFGSSSLEYRHRSSPRYEVAKNIYHSTTYPQDQCINMHSENSYAPQWAKRIIFCCTQPALERGETPIADNRLVVKFLSGITREKFSNYGVRYVRNISKGIGLSWEEVFQTSNRRAVEEECKNLGMKYSWEKDDKLVLTWYNNAIYDHPATKEQIWFNHAFFFNKHTLDEAALSAFKSDDELPFNTYYGDGSEISKAEVEEIRTAYQKATVIFPWVKGDVLFLDNMLMSHGRMPYKGDRKIIVSLL